MECAKARDRGPDLGHAAAAEIAQLDEFGLGEVLVLLLKQADKGTLQPVKQIVIPPP
jgi:hypothetical protein